MTETTIGGFAEDRFAPVRDAFAANLASGADVGACFTATVNGETVVDLWAGFADEAETRPWKKDTLWSTSIPPPSTTTALTALMLADRGESSISTALLVARYWPEFAANGKGGGQGQPPDEPLGRPLGLKEPIRPEDLYDWDKVTRPCWAAQAPYWEPGTASGYHAITQGYLVGEVVRRITGRTLGTVFREEIAEPLGADFTSAWPGEDACSPI